MTAQCVTLWIGDELGALERACLRSLIRQGHGIALYSYRRPDGVPDGVEIRDAGSILPESKAFTGRNGSVAAFSDWFRYELLDRGLGTWVDTDVYLLKPLDSHRTFLFGEESAGILNNAILRLPSESPMISLLLEPFRKAGIPRGLSWRQRLPLLVRKFAKGQMDLRRLPWGSTGPLALTAVARRCGVMADALPSDVFFPVHWRRANWIVDPAVTLDELTSDRTVAIHLWNECIKDLKTRPAPEGSFLRRLQDEGREG